MSANSPCISCTHRVVAPWLWGAVYPICLIKRIDYPDKVYPEGCESHRPDIKYIMAEAYATDTTILDAYEQITQFERDHGG